jgi:hypothetical protein
VQPVLRAGLPQFFLPVPPEAAGGSVVYQPRLLGAAEVVFADRRKGVEHRKTYRLLADPPADGQPVTWGTAQPVGEGLAPAPEAGAQWADVPPALNTAKKIKPLERAFAGYLQANARLTVYRNRKLGVTGTPEDDLAAFRETCRTLARQKAQEEIETEKVKLAAKKTALDGADAEPGDAPEPEEGAGLLDLVFRKLNPFAASSPIPAPPHRSSKDRARQDRQRDARRKLQEAWQAKVVAVGEKWRKAAEEIDDLGLTPRKADVRVTAFGLAWVPARGSADGPAIPPSPPNSGPRSRG